jgi:hypothetical protein
MKRRTGLAYLGAIVLLCGCAPEEYLPDPVLPGAVAPGPPPEPLVLPTTEPTRAVVELPAREDVLARWQLPATSPWLAYEKLTLPSVLAGARAWVEMPDVEELGEVQLAHLAGRTVAEAGVPDDAAWFVDLDGAASVAFATSLSHGLRDVTSVIPTFNNWPAENELVPAEQTLAAMITMSPRLPSADDPARPIFLLDSWRLAYKDEDIDDDVVDNRYMLGESDFPTADVLREHGIAQIIYVVASDEIEVEEDDLNDLFASYASAGIAIHLVSVATLARHREPTADPWYVEIRLRPFVVRPRVTVCHDPRFYRRARGGFGGAHLMPVPNGHVHYGFHGGG